MSNKATSRPATRLILWGIPALVGVLLIQRVLLFAQWGWERLQWPWQIDYTEGINLNTTLNLAAGHNIYRHNGPDGFMSAPYGPVYHMLLAPVSWLTGASLTPGRLLSLAASVAIALLIPYVVWRITRSWAAGLLAGGVWLTLSPVIGWAALYKQDLVAAAFDLAGFAWALSYPKGRRLYMAGLLFALAFYTKQSAISAAAATTLWLLLRDWRGGLRFGTALAALVGGPFLVVNLLLRGGLWEHLVGYHALPHTEGRLRKALTILVNENWPLLTAGGIGLLGFAFGGQETKDEGRRTKELTHHASRLRSLPALVIIYTLIGWAATISKSGYEGASFNHLLDGLLPTCILAGVTLGHLGGLAAGEEGRRAKRITHYALLFALYSLLAAQAFTPMNPHILFRGGVLSAERESEMVGISELVARTHGDIYSEDGHILLSNGRRVIYEDASTFVPLANLGLWDDSLFNQALRDRRFSLIILGRGAVRWTDEGLGALLDNYILKFPGTLDTYEPVLFPASPQYRLSCALSGEGDSLELQGYSLAPGVGWHGIGAGEILRVTLHWRTETTPEGSYASFVQVINEKNERMAGQDNPQTGATQPTTAWEPGKAITDTASIPLPANLEPGRYRLVAGAYRQEGGAIKSLSPSCKEGETFGEAVLLGWVEVIK